MAGASNKEIKKLLSIIREMRTGILVTHAGSQLKGRPIQIADISEDGTVWIYANEYSDCLKEITENNEVFLSFSEPGTDVYAVISARAYDEDNVEKIKSMKNPNMRLMRPAGGTAKNMMVLRAEPVEAEFWDGRSGRIVILFRMFSKLLNGAEMNFSQPQKIKKWKYT
jgi:general stress protein 26